MELESQPRRQESMRMRCGSADQRVDRPESTSWSAAAASAGLASFLPSASPPRCMSICLQPTAECRLHRSCKNETKKTTCSKLMVAYHLSNSQKYQQRKVSLRSTINTTPAARRTNRERSPCVEHHGLPVFAYCVPCLGQHGPTEARRALGPCWALLLLTRPGKARPDSISG